MFGWLLQSVLLGLLLAHGALAAQEVDGDVIIDRVEVGELKANLSPNHAQNDARMLIREYHNETLIRTNICRFYHEPLQGVDLEGTCRLTSSLDLERIDTFAYKISNFYSLVDFQIKFKRIGDLKKGSWSSLASVDLPDFKCEPGLNHIECFWDPAGEQSKLITGSRFATAVSMPVSE